MTARDRTVVVVGPMPPPIHGAARVTRDVVAGLAERPVALQVADTSADGVEGAGYHVRRVGAHLRAAALALRAPRESAVYLGGAGGFGIWYQTLVVLAARIRRLQIFFHHHSYAYLNDRDVAMAVLARCAGGSAEHIVLCPAMGDLLRSRYPVIARVQVCSNAGLVAPRTDAQSRVGSSRADSPDLVVGHLGNLMTSKGLAGVIDAFRAIHRDDPATRLLLGGPVIGRDAAELIAGLRAEFGDAVQLTGAVPADEVDGFYRQLDLFLMPSRYRHEAQPLVVLEAASCGVPAVAFDVGCLASLVPDAAHLVAVDGDFAEAAREVCAAMREPVARAVVREQTLERFGQLHAAAVGAQAALLSRLCGSALS